MGWVAGVSGSAIYAVPGIVALIYFSVENPCSDRGLRMSVKVTFCGWGGGRKVGAEALTGQWRKGISPFCQH